MKIRDAAGHLLYEGVFDTRTAAVTDAVAQGVDLSDAADPRIRLMFEELTDAELLDEDEDDEEDDDDDSDNEDDIDAYIKDDDRAPLKRDPDEDRYDLDY